MRSSSLLVIVALFGACAKSQTPDASAPIASAVHAPPPAPTGRLHVESPFPGGIAIVNDTDAAASIQWDLPIEREDSGKWTPVHSMTMMQKCFEPKTQCVSIAPHSSFQPLPWTGWFGCTQCGVCRANAPAVAGRYRVVAVECDGAARHEGPAMTIVEDGRFAKTPHVYAPPGEANAIVIDNEADEPISLRSAIDVAKLDATRNAYDTLVQGSYGLSTTTPCVTVAAHGSLRVPAFHAKPGVYMSTVFVCGGQKPMYNEVYGAYWRAPSFVIDASGAAKPER